MFLFFPFQERLERMEMDVQSLKEEVNAKSEELDIRLRCLHEFQMSTNQKHFAHAGENKAELRLVLAFNQTWAWQQIEGQKFFENISSIWENLDESKNTSEIFFSVCLYFPTIATWSSPVNGSILPNKCMQPFWNKFLKSLTRHPKTFLFYCT